MGVDGAHGVIFVKGRGGFVLKSRGGFMKVLGIHVEGEQGFRVGAGMSR